MKRYIIIATEIKTGKHFGYVEKSFTMDLDPNRVRVWSENEWSKDIFKISDTDREDARRKLEKGVGFENTYKTEAYTHPNSRAQYIWFVYRFKIESLKRSYPGLDFRLYRVGSKSCPFKVDIRERMLMKKKFIKFDKYEFWNSKFELK